MEKIEAGIHAGFRPCVFLEEIDKIKPSEYTVNQLFRIFDVLDRHSGNRATLTNPNETKTQLVLDSNFSKDQFKNVFGEMIVRRIKENCIVKEFGF